MARLDLKEVYTTLYNDSKNRLDCITDMLDNKLCLDKIINTFVNSIDKGINIKKVSKITEGIIDKVCIESEVVYKYRCNIDNHTKILTGLLPLNILISCYKNPILEGETHFRIITQIPDMSWSQGEVFYSKINDLLSKCNLSEDYQTMNNLSGLWLRQRKRDLYKCIWKDNTGKIYSIFDIVSTKYGEDKANYQMWGLITGR